MNTEIIICLISLLGTFTGSLIGAYTSSKLTNYRLEQIEKKHNNDKGTINLRYFSEKREGYFTRGEDKEVFE